MAKPSIYASEIRDGLGYGATWTPGTPLGLGIIGTFDSGIFIPKGNLATVGIKFEVTQDARPYKFTYASADGVQLNFKANGQSPQGFHSLAEVEAGVRIVFTRADAVVFSAENCYENRIADVLSLQQELAERLMRGTWPRDWAVVTHLVKAGSATIAFSASKNAALELQSTAAVGSGPAQLADISGSVGVSYSDTMSQIFVAQEGLTPLFHTIRLKRNFWRFIPGQPNSKALIDKSTRKIEVKKEITPEDFERFDG